MYLSDSINYDFPATFLEKEAFGRYRKLYQHKTFTYHAVFPSGRKSEPDLTLLRKPFSE